MKKIISYNINGVRAALKKDLLGWIKKENPNILCFQEIKANVDQFNVSDFEDLGYHSYWFSAQKKGYSGVAILTKEKPINVINGLGIEKFDSEGRFLQIDFKNFTFISSYFPSGTNELRQGFKMEYLEAVQEYLNKLKITNPNIIISGDYNICHKPIDINRPEKHKGYSGFLPDEREWVTNFLDSGFIDSFREYHTEGDRYSWWSYRAGSRGKNLGWRIDYNMVSEPLKNKLINADILDTVVHSDHCPILLEIDL